MTKPKLSIITPTHNRINLLDRAIKSVLSQTFQDFEMIIIDDSTNNETEEFIKKYKDHPKIVYLKNKKNEGLPFSRNRGFDVAAGEWVTLLDDDDLYVENSSLEKVFEILNTSKDNWLAFNRVDNNLVSFTKALIKKDSYNWTKDFLYGRAFRGDAVHFLKYNFIKNIRYSKYNQAQWWFWYELSQKSNFIHNNLPIVQTEYLEQGLSKTNRTEKDRLSHKQQLIEMSKHFSTLKYLPLIFVRYLFSFPFFKRLKFF